MDIRTDTTELRNVKVFPPNPQFMDMIWKDANVAISHLALFTFKLWCGGSESSNLYPCQKSCSCIWSVLYSNLVASKRCIQLVLCGPDGPNNRRSITMQSDTHNDCAYRVLLSYVDLSYCIRRTAMMYFFTQPSINLWTAVIATGF